MLINQNNNTLLHHEPPLCVDLDGTLINSDLLMESLFTLLNQNPFMIFIVPFWLIQGRAYLKEQLVHRVKIDVTNLPYHTEFLSYLRKLHNAGRRLVLATASHQCFAKEVGLYLGIFDAILATEHNQNFSSSRKGKCLASVYGERSFDYAGNSRADLSVWRYARNAILVNPVPGITKKTQALAPIIAIFDDRHHAWKAYLKALHLTRWLKNFLLFIPLIIANRYGENLYFAGLAFLSLSLCASSVYLFIDLLNLAPDRLIPHKYDNFFANGKVSIIHGVALVPLLLIAALLIAQFLPLIYLIILFGYYLFSLIYYVYSKSKIVNFLVGVALYMTRLFVGWIIIIN